MKDKLIVTNYQFDWKAYEEKRLCAFVKSEDKKFEAAIKKATKKK